MISDVLSKASELIQIHLDDATYDGVYSGAIRERIKRLVREMNEVRKELDQPPVAVPSPEPLAAEARELDDDDDDDCFHVQ